jgi:hypothetical protein
MPPPPPPLPPLLHRRGARPDPAPFGHPHRHLAPYALGSTPSNSSWEAFFQGALCRPDLRPRRRVNGAPPPPPATSRPMGGSPSWTSYASATSTPPADDPRPPTSPSELLLPRAVTAPSDRGQLSPPPATDRRSPLRSVDGLTSPAARTAPVVPRRTAFGDSTLDATAIHGDTEANRIQAGHPPRRSRPSTELL